MKKSNITQKKPSKNTNASEKNQKKIHSFFTKTPESQEKKDDTKKDVIVVTEIKNNTSINHNINKKRKRSESLDFESNIKMKNIRYGDVKGSLFDNSLKITDTKKENSKMSENCANDSLNICDETIKELDNSLLESLTDDLTIIDDEETTPSNSKNTIKVTDNKSQCNQSLDMVELNQMFNDMNNCEELNADDFNEIFDTEWNLDSQINLHSLERCEVINLEKNFNSMMLKVQHTELKSFGTVTCLGYWKDLQINEGDIVVIQAKKESQNWVVDNDYGYIVIKPDVLVSSTTIVGGLYCNRRAVLSEKFGRIESLPYFISNQMPLLIGKIVHMLLQKSIVENIYKIDDIRKMAEIELKSKDTIYMLYGSESTFEKCQEEVLSYVPQISEFIQHYVHDIQQKAISNDKDNFKGTISEVHDIEENIWLPKLGLKGKIDVTVEVKLHSRKKQIMPIEIKTGRPSFSLEHRGQVILYIMMMAFMGQETDSGLLLYLKNNKMREITCGRAEKRDLILLRNTLVDYFTKTRNIIFSDDLEDLLKNNMPLPEPINNYTSCQRCPYNNLCCAYLKKDDTLKLSESHGLIKLSKEILNVFEDKHIDFIFKWVSILQMEENIQAEQYNMKDIWTLTPEKRELKGNCISNLKVIGKVVPQYDRFKHIFVRTDSQTIINENISTEFVENEYVIVSTDTRINISSGFIMKINKNAITLLLNSNITKRNMIGNFHIDKYNSITSLSSTLFSNIGGLLYDNIICGRLRSIVIDKKPATFLTKLPRSVIFKSATVLQHLNEIQQRAILKCLAANEYVLIKGMPGTGKTETIVTLIEVLYKLGTSIIVTSHTHSAIDNILLKLVNKNIDFIRLGSSYSVNPLLKNKSEEYLTSECKTIEELDSVYSNKKIVGVTCYGSNHVFFEQRTFDVCIVDESTQVTQPAILGPLYNANKFILVGDPNQLPPVIRSKTAKNLGADISLFEKLDSENNTISLMLQYRMNKTIMNLINKLTYNDQLKAGNETIENATFVSPNTKIPSSNERWVKTVLSPALDDSVIILNTGCISEMTIDFIDKKDNIKTDQTCTNIWEAALILYLLKTLFQIGIECKQIGIIAPYKAQVMFIRSLVDSEIEINTVDQYQGRDKDIIFYSCTKSVSKKLDKVQDTGILEDHRRLTVAVTRAKHKLIIIADKDTMSQYTPFKQCFNIVEEKNVINIKDDYYDFAWEPVINTLKNNMSLQSNE
ncbi:PREDICTED: DNA replication ATP-dependent helicase/nuclease DNA2 [Polistes dominula]|uniref:DNA replication ATP-dependent helicase/nuclease n=1 Tax=Polistes dominula TaxID=743375 RepID=A0ABM1IDD9_POLDO|nr:PREDICTED: DNA replication ATP-dependent helicase/nuclease DNA2 [Polistes dominula]